MKINIYYGGRGIIDDPSLYVISRITEVLKELNVQVEQYNLFELKNNITALPNSLKDADGIILASASFMGGKINKKEIFEYIRYSYGIPVVSIGVELDNIPLVEYLSFSLPTVIYIHGE